MSCTACDMGVPKSFLCPIVNDAGHQVGDVSVPEKTYENLKTGLQQSDDPHSWKFDYRNLQVRKVSGASEIVFYIRPAGWAPADDC